MSPAITRNVPLSLLAVLMLFACSKNDQPDTLFRADGTMEVDGRNRTYYLNLPPNYYESEGFSLVIAMHGGGGDGLQFESTSKLTEKANAAQFIVVYPEGVESTGLLRARTWNAGSCCEYASDNDIDDVKFINQLIDLLLSKYKINPKKVYATGHSNGGMLSYRLACELPNKIAAIAPNGCSMVVKQPCNPNRSVPVLHMHSVLDTRVPHEGGVGVTGVYFPAILTVLDAWSTKNNCTTKAQVVQDNNDYKFMTWTTCTSGSAIHYYLTKDGGHGWPGGLPGGPNSDTPSKVINANDLLWDFFQQYQLP